MKIRAIDPSTEQVIAEFDEHTKEQVSAALDRATAAQRRWRECTLDERAVRLRALARILKERRERYATLLVREMGKPIVQARAEIDKCVWGCEFYAANGAKFLSDERVDTNARESIVAYEPLGLVLAVMPWNYPLWQVIRAAAPALMAGNGMVLKHASNVPQCALAVEEAIRDAGFPEGLFATLLLAGGNVEPVITDDRVHAVTLTGSSQTGARIAELAGHSLKKVVLELGGSDPYIVLHDADVDAAAKTAAFARNQNNGQSCIAAKRFLVVEPVAKEFEERFADAIRALKTGDPMDEKTDVGPLARADLRETVEEQVRKSVAMGARVVLGGKRPQRKGWFYEPTLLADVTEEMPVLREEVFGPVAALYRVRDTDDALRVANSTPYGLGAAVWSRDIDVARALARRIESGQVFINGMVASDPRLPFGGVKKSGHGRELSHFGIREFTNVQTIWIGPAQGAQQPIAAE